MSLKVVGSNPIFRLGITASFLYGACKVGLRGFTAAQLISLFIGNYFHTGRSATTPALRPPPTKDLIMNANEKCYQTGNYSEDCNCNKCSHQKECNGESEDEQRED